MFACGARGPIAGIGAGVAPFPRMATREIRKLWATLRRRAGRSRRSDRVRIGLMGPMCLVVAVAVAVVVVVGGHR